jgi:hypothetical protein
MQKKCSTHNLVLKICKTSCPIIKVIPSLDANLCPSEESIVYDLHHEISLHNNSWINSIDFYNIPSNQLNDTISMD